jgi:glucokinase
MIGIARREAGRLGRISSVGIGVPGLFDPAAGVIELFPNLPGPWKGHPLRDPIGDALGVPATLINDARAFTLAEATIGAGKGSRTIACLTLGTGIGGGVMIEGKLHLGAFGTAGEIGHQIVEPDGPPCGCGNRGCIEALARSDVLTRMAGRDTVEEVYRAAADGDERSRNAIETAARYLGIGIANIIAVLGPERIVIGGGIAHAGEAALAPIRKAVWERVTLVPHGAVPIVAARLGSTAGAIGAALAARSNTSGVGGQSTP